MRQRAFAAVFAVLVVTAMLPAGLATAQEQPTSYDRTFTEGQELIGVNTGNFSGDFTFQVTAGDATGGATTLYQEDLNVGESAQLVYFANYGAYDNITVSVIPRGNNSGAPDLIDGKEAPAVGSRHITSSTGGDADLTCDPAEKLNSIVNPLNHIVDCNKPLPGANQINTTGVDAEQTEIDIYQAAQNQKQSFQTANATLSNRLEDAKTVARIKGKNAYIRALNNGTSEAGARTAAKEAVTDHYATIQKNYATTIEQNQIAFSQWHQTANNESGISNQFVMPKDDMFTDQSVATETVTVTFVDGTTREVRIFGVMDSGYTPNTFYEFSAFASSDLSHGTYDLMEGGGNYDMNVEPPTTMNESTLYLHGASSSPDKAEAWNTIKSQRQTVHGDMDTLVNNTYTEYQNGEINNSDLVDPYVLSSEFSPGSEYQGWAAVQLTLMGTNSPDNFDQIGRFNVTTDSGDEFQGVLFSQANPPSGQFARNETYDPANIDGTQYVVTAESIEELEEPFTIESITTTDGESRDNVTIVEKTYETTNTTELKQVYEDLAFWRAQAEAREQALKAEGGDGGGGLFPGDGSVPPMAALGFIAAIVLLALVND